MESAASSLAEAFVNALPARLRSEAQPEELAPAIEGWVRAARAAWPGLRLDAAPFVAWVAERMESHPSLAEGLATVRASDLYLACACARGDVAAMKFFEEHCFGEAEAALARVAPSNRPASELRQALRERLFVAQPPRRAKVAEYSGLGDLKKWVRVVAVRLGADLARERDPDEVLRATSVELLALPAVEDSPEIARLKAECQPAFVEAVRRAMQKLTPRERNAIRLSLIHGLTAQEIADLHRVHRVSVARWLGRARGLLSEEVRRLLAERLQVSDSELRSLTRTMISHFELDLESLLRSAR